MMNRIEAVKIARKLELLAGRQQAVLDFLDVICRDPNEWWPPLELKERIGILLGVEKAETPEKGD